MYYSPRPQENLQRVYTLIKIQPHIKWIVLFIGSIYSFRFKSIQKINSFSEIAHHLFVLLHSTTRDLYFKLWSINICKNRIVIRYNIICRYTIAFYVTKRMQWLPWKLKNILNHVAHGTHSHIHTHTNFDTLATQDVHLCCIIITLLFVYCIMWTKNINNRIYSATLL